MDAIQVKPAKLPNGAWGVRTTEGRRHALIEIVTQSGKKWLGKLTNEVSSDIWEYSPIVSGTMSLDEFILHKQFGGELAEMKRKGNMLDRYIEKMERRDTRVSEETRAWIEERYSHLTEDEKNYWFNLFMEEYFRVEFSEEDVSWEDIIDVHYYR